MPPEGHPVAWIAVSGGVVAAPAAVNAGALVIFEESDAALDSRATTDRVFVSGSAAKHPSELFMGNYAAHTSAEALRPGEAGMEPKADRMRAGGR